MKGAFMFADRNLFLAAILLASGSTLQAQTCSGGPDGGMDATGNQCSTWVEPASGDAPTETRRDTADPGSSHEVSKPAHPESGVRDGEAPEASDIPSPAYWRVVKLA